MEEEGRKKKRMRRCREKKMEERIGIPRVILSFHASQVS